MVLCSVVTIKMIHVCALLYEDKTGTGKEVDKFNYRKKNIF